MRLPDEDNKFVLKECSEVSECLTKEDIYRAVESVKNTCFSSNYTYKYAPPFTSSLASEPSELWEDYVRRTFLDSNPGTTIVTMPGYSGYYESHPWRHFADVFPKKDDIFYREEDKPQMSFGEHIDTETFKGYRDRYVNVRCTYAPDLEQDKILRCLSIMKSELMMKCAPFKVDRVTCKMSPQVKQNIIKAWKRLSMYGKKIPFVACYDEYGRRLNDKVEIDTLHGMIISVVNPDECGEHLLEFEGVIRDVDGK